MLSQYRQNLHTKHEETNAQKNIPVIPRSHTPRKDERHAGEQQQEKKHSITTADKLRPNETLSDRDYSDFLIVVVHLRAAMPLQC